MTYTKALAVLAAVLMVVVGVSAAVGTELATGDVSGDDDAFGDGEMTTHTANASGATTTQTTNASETTMQETTTPETMDGNATASVSFEDQRITSTNTTVLVNATTLPKGGFITITAENGTIIGNSTFLEPGTHQNVTIPLEVSLNNQQVLIATAHRDTNDNRQFDFNASKKTILEVDDPANATAVDGPYVANGSAVSDVALVFLEKQARETQTEQAEETTTVQETTPAAIRQANASLTFNDQVAGENGSTVTLQSATLSEGGFVAIAAQNGTIIGTTTFLEAGTHENVTVMLNVSLNRPQVVVATAHRDTNDNRQFDFNASKLTLLEVDDPANATAVDGPVIDNGTAVSDVAFVSLEPRTRATTTVNETQSSLRRPTATDVE